MKTVHRVGNTGGPWLSLIRTTVTAGSLWTMERERRTVTIKDIWRLALAIIGVIAIVQELRKPKDERTWHGEVADFVPYDFRMPTVERVKTTYWNPDGPLFSSKVFGVGWAPNFGVLAGWLGQAQSEGAPSEGTPVSEE